jgi:hypothetical protein
MLTAPFPFPPPLAIPRPARVLLATALLSLPLLMHAAPAALAQSPPEHPAATAAFTPVDIRTFPSGTDTLDVFLLLGQSNMMGRGELPAEQTESPRIVMMHLRDDQWYRAREPLHLMGQPSGFAHARGAGVGPGLTFARDIAPHLPHDRIALVPGAVGGTGIDLWVKGAPLYTAAMKRAKLALAEGPPGHTRLAGILWIQGERDSRGDTNYLSYQKKLDGMIRAMRAELGQADLPFIAATVGPVAETPAMRERYPHRADINAILLALPKRVRFTACVDARDLTGHIGDGLHYNTASQHIIGRRLAGAWLALARGQ